MTRVALPGHPWSWQTDEPAGSVALVTRQFATGVSVLTCADNKGVDGVTVSTLALASIEPPMVSVALRRGSRALAALLRSSVFVANGLSSRQESLARYFARSDRSALPDDAIWAGCTAGGTPLLGAALGWLECRIEQTVPVGDHELVLARVLHAARGTGVPLLNYAGSLHTGSACPYRH